MNNTEQLIDQLSTFWTVGVVFVTLLTALYISATKRAAKNVRHHLIRYKTLLAHENIEFFESEDSKKLPARRAKFTFKGKSFIAHISPIKTLAIIRELEKYGYVNIDYLEDKSIW